MNLAAGQYTVDVTADHFDGTLYFTTLHVTRSVDAPIVDDPDVPEPPEDVAAPIPHAPIGAGVPTAVAVSDGALVIGLVPVFEGNGSGENETSPDRDWWQGHDHDAHRARATDVHVYDPWDGYVGVFTLTRDDPVLVLEDLELGEYVLYAAQRGASRGDFVAAVAKVDADAEPTIRGLDLVRGSVERAGYNELFGFSDTFNVTFDAPPLEMAVDISRSTAAVEFRAIAQSPEGWAYHMDAYLTTFGVYMGGGQDMDREKLTPGEYFITYEAQSFMGDATLRWVTYDRDTEVGAVEELEDEEDVESSKGASETAWNAGVTASSSAWEAAATGSMTTWEAMATASSSAWNTAATASTTAWGTLFG
jgi:hypothetical protein